MESIDPVWFFGAIALATGLLLGLLISRLLNPSTDDVEQLKAELESARTEMERYKASVNSHFNKTSELVNDLTQDYVKVYRHLAEGAQTLSDTGEFSHVLEQQKGRVLLSVEDRPSPAPAAVGAGDTTGETPRPSAVSNDIVEDRPPVTVAEEADSTEVDDESKVTATEDVKDTAEAGAAGDDRKQAVGDAGAATAETIAETTTETVADSDDAGEAKTLDDEQARQAEAAQQQPAAAAEGEAEAESSKKA